MKVKFSVIPFALAAIAMIFFRVMSVFGMDESGNFLGMDKMVLSYTVIGIALGLFIICILLNIFDRKTAPVYPVNKNFAAGALAILAGVSVIAASIYSMIETTVNSEYYTMSIISACFSVPAGIALALMSKVHFTGKSTVSGISFIYVFPALWGCTELVFEFLNATKVSISATDLTGLFCYIFLTLYYFSHSMVISRIKGRNPVKSCFIYGLPAVALTLSNGVYVLFTSMQEGMTTAVLLTAVQFIILGLYALSFIIEMFVHSYTKDELEIVDSLPEEDSTEEEDKYIETKGYDDLVISNSASITDPHVDPSDDYFSSAKGLDDYILGYSADEEEEPSDTKKEKKLFKKEKAQKKAPEVEPEPAEEVKEEPAAEPEPEAAPVEEKQPEPVKEEAKAEPEPEKIVAPTEEVPEEIQKAIEDIMPKNVKTQEEKEADRLSEIDKLLKELDSKSE